MRAVLLAMFVALAPASTVSAQETTTTTVEYKPLTFWNKFSLGSTYFTNATLAKNIEVAYSFELNDLPAKIKNDELSALAKEGKVIFGVVDKTSNSIKSVPADVATVADLKRAYPNEKLVVLSPSETLFGKTTSAAVYTLRDRDKTR